MLPEPLDLLDPRPGTDPRSGSAGLELEPDPESPHRTASSGGMPPGSLCSALQIGPASRALDGHPPEVRAAAAQSVKQALAPFARGANVPLPGSIWIVTARAS